MNKLSEYFPTLQNSDIYYEKITDESRIIKTLLGLISLLAVLTFIYGIVMGSYHSVSQSLVAGLKLFSLFILVLIICFPAFFIIQYILGSTLKLGQMLAIILSGFTLMSAIMVSFSPIIIFFHLTGSNYYFLQILHILIFTLSGFFGMKTVNDALQYSCEKKNIYPRIGVVVFRYWIIILAFVGIQLAWNLRPFLGDYQKPFKLFRSYEGNFYTALVYSVKKLSEPENMWKLRNQNESKKAEEDTVSVYELYKND